MNDTATHQLHASAVAIGSKGVLLLGASGAGKSDLALRLIDGGAVLVADDRVDIESTGGALLLSAPEQLAGMIEVRGLGIVRLSFETKVSLSLIVDLVKPEDVERLPATIQGEFMGQQVRRFVLDPFSASAPAKIRLALSATDQAMLSP